RPSPRKNRPKQSGLLGRTFSHFALRSWRLCGQFAARKDAKSAKQKDSTLQEADSGYSMIFGAWNSPDLVGVGVPMISCGIVSGRFGSGFTVSSGSHSKTSLD